MGDLIAVLNHLLRGELTARFVLKACIVLMLSGGVFFYYFSGLRRADTAQARQQRDRFMIFSSASVAIIVILGFWQLGTPGTQRQIRADAQRVQGLIETSNQIGRYWGVHQQLPDNLRMLPAELSEDPNTHTAYEYQAGKSSQYQLCATFARVSDSRERAPEQRGWNHPVGHHCFTLDATAAPQYPTPYIAF